MPLLAANADDRLVIYLNDHLALIAAERELATRACRANTSTKFADMLATHVDDLARQHTLIRSALDQTDGTPNRFKPFAARLGERLGRLKLNGQLTGYSPLSRIVEFEGLLASGTLRAQLWATVTETHLLRASSMSDDLSEAIQQTEHHISALTEALTTARTEAFNTSAPD